MSDHKKVAFAAVAPIENTKNPAKRSHTIRLSITLLESNEKSCPQFNYGDLLTQHLQKRLDKKRQGEVINGKPPLEPGDPYASDEDEALKALARKFEKKYGGISPKSGKRRKKRKDNDFKQLGEGYDESDPFIDNSAAVDDVVPKNLETKHRGFYINSGELDFEEIQVSEDEKTNDCQPQVNRKRANVISSDEESDSAIEDKPTAKADVVRENGSLKLKRRKLDEGELLRRRKKIINKFNAKKLKKKLELQENKIAPHPEEYIEKDKPVSDSVPVEAKDMSIAASIEAVVSKAREAVAGEGNSSASSSSSSNSSSESSSSDSESEEEKESDNEESNKEDEVPSAVLVDNGNSNPSEGEKENLLPANLPQDLIDDIDKLKEIGRNSKGSSQKFFTDTVNKLVLSIEIKVSKFGGRKKTLIYTHMSHHLPCGTQTLIKRGKNLLSDSLEKRLKAPTESLKEAVEKAMPPLIQIHAEECRKAVEKNPQQYWELYYHFWGQSPPDGTKTADEVKDNHKKLKLPKKKFIFTDQIRKLLLDMVKIRIKGYSLIKKRFETLEEHINTYLDTEVKPVWPKGWMTTKTLYKEIEPAFLKSKTSAKDGGKKKMVILGGGTVSNVTKTEESSIKMDTSADESFKSEVKNESLLNHSTAPSSIKDIVDRVVSSSITEIEPFISDSHVKQDKSVKGGLDREKLPVEVVAKSLKVVKDPPVFDSSSSALNLSKDSTSSTPAEVIAKHLLNMEELKKEGRKDYKYDSDILSAERKPPKPSLSATALPKSSVCSTQTIQKSPNHQAMPQMQPVPKPQPSPKNPLHPIQKGSISQDIQKPLQTSMQKTSQQHSHSEHKPLQSSNQTSKLQHQPPTSQQQSLQTSFQHILPPYQSPHQLSQRQHSSMQNKVEAVKKMNDDIKKIDDSKTITCISIKSVDRINDSHGDMNKKKHNPSKSETSLTSTYIDISTDDSCRKILSHGTKISQQEPKRLSGEIKVNNPVQGERVNNKLEKEIDTVMNEILEISKQRSNGDVIKPSEPQKQNSFIGFNLKSKEVSSDVSPVGEKIHSVHQILQPQTSRSDSHRLNAITPPSPNTRPPGFTSPIMSKKAHLLADFNASSAAAAHNESSYQRSTPHSNPPVSVATSQSRSPNFSSPHQDSLVKNSYSVSQSICPQNLMARSISRANEEHIRSSNQGRSFSSQSAFSQGKVVSPVKNDRMRVADMNVPYRKDTDSSSHSKSSQRGNSNSHQMNEHYSSQRTHSRMEPRKVSLTRDSSLSSTAIQQPNPTYATNYSKTSSVPSTPSPTANQSTIQRSPVSPHSLSYNNSSQRSLNTSFADRFSSNQEPPLNSYISSSSPSQAIDYVSRNDSIRQPSSSPTQKMSRLSSCGTTISAVQRQSQVTSASQSSSPNVSQSYSSLGYNLKNISQPSTTSSLPRQKHPSHNIEGLLYNSSYKLSSSNVNYPPHPLDASRKSRQSYSMDHVSPKSTSNSAAGNGRSNESLSGRSSAKVPSGYSQEYLSSLTSRSSASSGSSLQPPSIAHQSSSHRNPSVLPKTKHRNSSNAIPELRQSVMGNQSALNNNQQRNNQPEFWQSQMNAPNFLSQSELFKFQSSAQSNLYDGSSNSSNSSKKPSSQEYHNR